MTFKFNPKQVLKTKAKGRQIGYLQKITQMASRQVADDSDSEIS